jgi:hypothetical protein
VNGGPTTSGPGVPTVDTTAGGAPGPYSLAPGTGAVHGAVTTIGCGVGTAGFPSGWLAVTLTGGVGTGVNGGVTTRGCGLAVPDTTGAAGLDVMSAPGTGVARNGGDTTSGGGVTATPAVPNSSAPGTGGRTYVGVTTSGSGEPTAGLPSGWLAEICTAGIATGVHGGLTTSGCGLLAELVTAPGMRNRIAEPSCDSAALWVPV